MYDIVPEISELCTAKNSTILWDITPCSLLKVGRHFGGAYHLHLKSLLCLPFAFMQVSCSAYSLTLKMEAIWSSEMLVDF
jgi:hypothetical protein